MESEDERTQLDIEPRLGTHLARICWLFSEESDGLTAEPETVHVHKTLVLDRLWYDSERLGVNVDTTKKDAATSSELPSTKRRRKLFYGRQFSSYRDARTINANVRK